MNLKLVFLVILFLLYFAHDAGLSWFFKRRYRKDDNFMGRNAPDEVQRYFGKVVYLVMAYYLLVLVSLATGFDFWGLISDMTLLNKPPFQFGGFALGTAFLSLMTLARLNLGASWRVGLDQSTSDGLVTHGFYRYIRNPYFTFLMAFESSLILISPNTVVIAAAIQSMLLLGLQARQEELFLEQKYGEPYREYRKRTGRFLPGFLGMRG
ncbi:MAG: isoprenylcysteine carboxylmethyltransferase family protein [Chloroflexota bacterium]